MALIERLLAGRITKGTLTIHLFQRQAQSHWARHRRLAGR